MEKLRYMGVIARTERRLSMRFNVLNVKEQMGKHGIFEALKLFAKGNFYE